VHHQDKSTGYVESYGGRSQLKLSGKGQSKLELSGNGKECKPLLVGLSEKRELVARATELLVAKAKEAGAYTPSLFIST
jgi:hypothetical protein